jgi:two-component system sensor histidine kinase AtoS
MDSKDRSKSIRLQTRLIFYSTLLILFLMVLVVLMVEKRQTEIIELEARKRGMAIAQNLAAVSTNALLTYNYVVLQQNGGKVAQEEDIAYVIIHDKEDRVAFYSGHDEKQGTVLTDKISERALGTQGPLTQVFHSGETKKPVLDISIPVYIKESAERWGTVRMGLSLERMHDQIARTRLNLLLLAGLAILLGVLGSIFFARRITRPISRLVDTTISAAQGNLDLAIDIRTGDEIEELSRNFNYMIGQIRLQRTELEKRLREITSWKAYTDNVLASMTNGLITVDLEGRIVTLNGMAERILGKTREEMEGRLYEQALDLHSPLGQTMTETLSREKAIFHSEMELNKGEGSLWLMISTSLLTDGAGKKIGALAVFQDITEIKALEEKLRQADRLAALGTVSAGLAHEIKNPLSAVKTFVQLLPKKSQNPTFLEKFNITVPREIDRINQLVEDLLELTRSRKRPWAPVNVNPLLLQVTELHGEEMKKKEISFENHLEPNLPSIQGDPDSLYRAFSNIVINSIQAMPNGGVLKVLSEADPVPAMVKITFKDSGIGMDEKTTKNLFNPFFTTKDKGVGLGMALTHKIIEDHRGIIEVFSEPGKGSTFTVRLPVTKM